MNDHLKRRTDRIFTMTQKQLTLANFRLTYDEFKRLDLFENRIVCDINDRFSIIIKRSHSKRVYVLIRSGKKCLKLPMSMFNAVCNAQWSVNYIKGLLHEQFSSENSLLDNGG